MATKEELFAAIRLIRETCAKTYLRADLGCDDCKLSEYCLNGNYEFGIPADWPDTEEGGGDDG